MTLIRFARSEEEVDQTYQVLKRANEISKPGAGVGGSGSGGPVVLVSAPAPGSDTPPAPARSPARPSAGLAVAPSPLSSSSGLELACRSSRAVGRRPAPIDRPAPAAGSFRSLVFSSVELFLHAFPYSRGRREGCGRGASDGRARRRRAAAALRRRQEFVVVGLAVAPRLAAAPVHFST